MRTRPPETDIIVAEFMKDPRFHRRHQFINRHWWAYQDEDGTWQPDIGCLIIDRAISSLVIGNLGHRTPMLAYMYLRIRAKLSAHLTVDRLPGRLPD